MKISDIIASGAALIALLSFAVSFYSYRISRKTYLLSKAQHDERSSGIAPYLIDAKKWHKEENTYISFSILYTNLASIPNSLKEIELHVEYYDQDNKLQTMKLPVDTTVSPLDLSESYKLLETPVNVIERSSCSGWVTFRMPKAMRDFQIELYKVNAKTAQNDNVSVEIHFITAYK